MKKILLPLEKSNEEAEVIDEVVKIAKNFDSTITIFHVDDSKVIINELNYSPEAYEEILKNREVDNKKIIKAYEDLGLKIQVKETAGDPPVEIIEEAEKGGYDLVLMSTHVMTGPSRFILVRVAV